MLLSKSRSSRQQALLRACCSYSTTARPTYGCCWSSKSLLVIYTIFSILTLLIVPNQIIIIQNAQAFQSVAAGPLQPTFTRNMDLMIINENTPIGEVVYTLEAQIDRDFQQQAKIIYGIEGTQLFSVDKLSGQVRVSQTIDREKTSDSITFQVSATAAYNLNPPGQPLRFQYGLATQITITVLILDENDNAPKIKRVKIGQKIIDSIALARQLSTSSDNIQSTTPSGELIGGGGQLKSPVVALNVSESLPTGSVLVDLIEAIDADKASSNPLRALCPHCEPEFEIRSSSDNLLNDRLELSIASAGKLVHIPRNNIKQLPIIITDGKFNSTIIFEITIEDVQDKPPQFIGPTTYVVNENIPIDKTILVIQAIDGDAIIFDENGAATLPKHSEGPNNQIGRQILYDLLIPGEGQSTSAIGDFKLHPLTGQLQVANRLDREAYLGSSGVLSLRVRARELMINAEAIARQQDDLYESMLEKMAPFVDQSSASTSEIDFTIMLADLNDNEPHWLNASEILALDMNQAPDWFNSLPTDRDTGQIYQFKVKENSLAGAPITLKNEMFVYDLDNGANANFNITLIDPFNLFDVEPKQVSGFATITLKLASNRLSTATGTTSSMRKPNAPDITGLLDYENPNERSFIIQLIATETNTNERFSSKAQVQINVLDVNDNVPEFKESAYIANIREDAPIGKSVLLVQATDKDEISSTQLTYSLQGRSAHLFDINPQTGLITVAKCSISPPVVPPSSGRTRLTPLQQTTSKPCIDYESQRSHSLMIGVSDGELSSRVPLTVFIDDANDNPPVFSLPVVDVVIEEGTSRLDFPIKIEATDVDQSSVLTYSIVEGNFEGLFSINNATGELQLTRPIKIAHEDLTSVAIGGIGDYRQQQLNKMTLVVQATDGVFATNVTIRIDVLDSNDNPPKFIRAQYSAEIHELMSRDQIVTTVRAIDSDRGNNARVSYKIVRGSYGHFEIDESTGVISVLSPSPPETAGFEVSKRKNYTLEVMAYDHGLNSKSSSVLVHVHVLDTIRKAPKLEPQIQRTIIPESTPNNTIVHRMSIQTSDQQGQTIIHEANSIVYFELGPIEALDNSGHPVSNKNERLDSLFSVSPNTGDVLVNSALDYDFASHINLTIFVSFARQQQQSSSSTLSNMDNNNTSTLSTEQPVEEFVPRSVGYLIVDVMDDNGFAPIFAPPWSLQQPELNYQMLEELPVGSVLAQLVASDQDSMISHFKIEPSNEYFELTSPQSGVIVNKKLIDYDTLMSIQTSQTGQRNSTTISAGLVGTNVIQFSVSVYDSGSPQLSARAIVSVEIMPVNDWDCKFEQSMYEVRLKENTPPHSLVLQVHANDNDYGEQHNAIRYQLVGKHSDLFNIDARNGLISVSTKGSHSLDSERLSSKLVLTVLGSDDLYQQQQVPSPQTRTKSQQQGVRSCSTTIKVNLDDVNDNPPLFSQRIYEVTAFDTDVIDVPLIKLLVRDEDSLGAFSDNVTTLSKSLTLAPVINTFKIISGNINDSFNITSAGMIYAVKPLNQSSSSIGFPLQLRVQVKQQSSNPASGAMASFTDDCLVHVNLVKINRYGPEWRFDASKPISVKENSRPGTFVTQLRCVDRDLEAHNRNRLVEPTESTAGSSVENVVRRSDVKSSGTASPIRYWIKTNNSNVLETNQFKLDPISGNLVTKIELDREAQEYHELIVACEDNGKPQSLDSLSSLFITVLDVDDNDPEFLVSKTPDSATSSLDQSFNSQQFPANSNSKQKIQRPTINFSIEEHQSKGLPVGELKAIDRDLKAQFPISYCLIEGNEFKDFSLDRITGILYTNQTLDRERQSSYDLLVKAINDGSSCDDHFVSPIATSVSPVTGSSKQDSFNIANSTRISTQQQSKVKRSPVLQQQQSMRILEITSDQKQQKQQQLELNYILVRVIVLDINDNAPVFKRPIYKAGVHHKALMNFLVTQVSAFDPDFGANGTLGYKISETLMYKTSITQHQSFSKAKYDVSSDHQPLSKPIKLIQSPFRIDKQGNLYTNQVLTQYPLMSMFVLQIEASEQVEPWRTAKTKLEIYVFETSNQLKIRINLHPRLVETYLEELETLFSNATRYTAIINRARDYHETSMLPAAVATNSAANRYNLKSISKQREASIIASEDHNTYEQQVPTPSYSTNQDGSGSSSTNIHLIFVDNFRIVNPNSVMGKFDLTSAQLFMPQSLTTQTKLSASSKEATAGSLAKSSKELQLQQSSSNEVASLIDKIALASSVQQAEYVSASSLVGIDWLERASVIYVTLTSLLFIIGIIIFMFGCCCTSRIKDHVVKVAMDKLIKQQTIQAKLHEQMLASANQAAGGNLLDGQEFIFEQGGFMSSFDATKGCVINNNENMNILQRAMDAGEFIDPNYTTLNGRINMGAHYYDATEIEPDDITHINNNSGIYGTSKQLNGSTNNSNSLADDEVIEDDDKIINVGNLSNGQQQFMVKSKVSSNNKIMTTSISQHNQRQRQQVPNNNSSNNNN